MAIVVIKCVLWSFQLMEIYLVWILYIYIHSYIKCKWYNIACTGLVIEDTRYSLCILLQIPSEHTSVPYSIIFLMKPLCIMECVACCMNLHWSIFSIITLLMAHFCFCLSHLLYMVHERSKGLRILHC